MKRKYCCCSCLINKIMKLRLRKAMSRPQGSIGKSLVGTQSQFCLILKLKLSLFEAILPSKKLLLMHTLPTHPLPSTFIGSICIFCCLFMCMCEEPSSNAQYCLLSGAGIWESTALDQGALTWNHGSCSLCKSNWPLWGPPLTIYHDLTEFLSYCLF